MLATEILAHGVAPTNLAAGPRFQVTSHAIATLGGARVTQPRVGFTRVPKDKGARRPVPEPGVGEGGPERRERVTHLALLE